MAVLKRALHEECTFTVGQVKMARDKGASIYDVRTEGGRGVPSKADIHWISLSTWDLGLVQIRVISDSCCKQLRMPIRRGPNADLHCVITDFSRYIRLTLQ